MSALALFEHRGATFSDDRAYRYSLFRQWCDVQPTLVVIGLNPSTADEYEDDPTIRRCIGFAKREQCGTLVMLNLFAIRATDPRAMLAHPEPVGAENDATLRGYANRFGSIVVAAWGAHGIHRGRDKVVAALIPGMRCFGITKSGQPKHPLYLAANTPLVPFAPSDASSLTPGLDPKGDGE